MFSISDYYGFLVVLNVHYFIKYSLKIITSYRKSVLNAFKIIFAEICYLNE